MSSLIIVLKRNDLQKICDAKIFLCVCEVDQQCRRNVILKMAKGAVML